MIGIPGPLGDSGVSVTGVKNHKYILLWHLYIKIIVMVLGSNLLPVSLSFFDSPSNSALLLGAMGESGLQGLNGQEGEKGDTGRTYGSLLSYGNISDFFPHILADHNNIQ